MHTLGLFIIMETPYNPSSGGISSGQQLRPKCACGFLRLQAGNLQSSFIHLHLQWERPFLLCSYDENPSRTCLCSAYHTVDTCPGRPWMAGCPLLSEW